MPDWFFALLMIARFGRPGAWQTMLVDGDTGWHIRTGDYILAHGVPATDLFSFSRPGERWFAWEWLSDLIFALLHRRWGLAGVAALGGVLVCLTSTILFAWLLRRGAGAWVSLAVALTATSAASVHDLARPHLFSLALFAGGLWLLDEDRHQPTAWLWTLVPLAAWWANLHGSFVAWIATLSVLMIASAAQRDFFATRRYGLLAALSAAATLLNPYGWKLHLHVLSYLRSSWIANHIQEFQSPQIRSESMWIFALLLLAAITATARGWNRRQWFEGSLALLWALAALRSARHIPMFAIVAAPVIASSVAGWWRRHAERSSIQSPLRVLWDSSRELGAYNRVTLWCPILGGLALILVYPNAGLGDFPPTIFPAAAVARHAEWLASSDARVLSSDQWSDYLIYRLAPRARVFFDGRSDFYGEQIGDDYQELQSGGRRSAAILARYEINTALLPLDWPLGEILERDANWCVVYRDAQAVLLEQKR